MAINYKKLLPSLSDIKYREINLEYLNKNELDKLITIQSLLRVPSIKRLIEDVESKAIPDIEIEIVKLLEYTFNNNTFDNFKSHIVIENIIDYAEKNYSIDKKGFFFDNFITEESKIYEYYANRLAIRYNHFIFMKNFYEEELGWRNIIIEKLKEYDIHFLNLISYIYKTPKYETFSLTKERTYNQITYLLDYKKRTFDFCSNEYYEEIEEENKENTVVINALSIIEKAPCLYSSNIPNLYINFNMNTPLEYLKEQLEDVYTSFQNKEIKILTNEKLYGGKKFNITEEVLDKKLLRKKYVLLFYIYDCYKILKNLDSSLSDESIFELIDRKIYEFKENTSLINHYEIINGRTYRNYKKLLTQLIDNQGFKTILSI